MACSVYPGINLVLIYICLFVHERTKEDKKEKKIRMKKNNNNNNKDHLALHCAHKTDHFVNFLVQFAIMIKETQK